MLRTALIPLALACGLATAGLAGAPPALAAGLSPPVADCTQHQRLTHHYSPSELQSALSTMPSDLAEYGNCYDVLQRQLLSELGNARLGHETSAGSGGSFLPTPVIIAIVVLGLGAATLGALALRRRGAPGGDEEP